MAFGAPMQIRLREFEKNVLKLELYHCLFYHPLRKIDVWTCFNFSSDCLSEIPDMPVRQCLIFVKPWDGKHSVWLTITVEIKVHLRKDWRWLLKSLCWPPTLASTSPLSQTRPMILFPPALRKCHHSRKIVSIKTTLTKAPTQIPLLLALGYVSTSA